MKRPQEGIMESESDRKLTDFYECLYASSEELAAFLNDPDGYLADSERTCNRNLSDEQKDLILSGDATAIRLALQEEQNFAPASYRRPTVLVKLKDTDI